VNAASTNRPGEFVSRDERRPRVVFVNRSYWPDAEATGQLLTELAEDLSRTCDVTVVAGPPNQNVEQCEYRPAGWDVHRGVRIRRVRCTRFSKSSRVGRVINYLTFVVAAGIAALAIGRPDAFVVETDPPLLCFVGLAARWLRRAKLVAYLQDIYPDLAVALGKLPSNVFVRGLRKAMFACHRRADRIVVLSRDMCELLVRSGIDAGKIECVPNWIDTRHVTPVKQENRFTRQHDLAGRFVVMYSGNLGQCQRLEDILAAARLLRMRDDILFLMVGDGAMKETLKEYAREWRLQNVRFLPYQARSELSQSLSAAQLHLLPVDPRIVSCLMPSKLYGILASGTPLLAIAPRDCELSESVESLDVGEVIPPADPVLLADTVVRLSRSAGQLDAWGKNARRAAEQLFDRSISTASFARVLASVIYGDEADVMVPGAESVSASAATVAEYRSLAPVETTCP